MSDLVVDPDKIGLYGHRKKKYINDSLQEPFKLPTLNDSQNDTKKPQKTVESMAFKVIQNRPNYIQDTFPLPLKDLESMTPLPSQSDKVTGLSLTNTGLHDQTLGPLVKSIAEKKHQHSALFLAKNNISDPGAKALSQALKKDTHVKHLILSDNKITDFAAAALADLLKVNHQIGWLVLSKNKLADQTGIQIGHSIQHNKTLKHIVLDGNEIGDIGAIGLARGLKKNTSVKSLFLQDNNIEKSGAMALASMLKHNHTLERLNLEGNMLDKESVVALQSSIKNKPKFELKL